MYLEIDPSDSLVAMKSKIDNNIRRGAFIQFQNNLFALKRTGSPFDAERVAQAADNLHRQWFGVTSL